MQFFIHQYIMENNSDEITKKNEAKIIIKPT